MKNIFGIHCASVRLTPNAQSGLKTHPLMFLKALELVNRKQRKAIIRIWGIYGTVVAGFILLCVNRESRQLFSFRA